MVKKTSGDKYAADQLKGAGKLLMVIADTEEAVLTLDGRPFEITQKTKDSFLALAIYLQEVLKIDIFTNKNGH